MNHNDQQLLKEINAPASKYDYDGITGTWLLIPARIHLLLLAITLPVIIWVLPHISFRGNFRYILADYRYYLAGAVAIFCISSALLSLLKAKQVKSRIRPTNSVKPQIIAKIGPGRPAVTAKKATPPTLPIQLKPNNSAKTTNPVREDKVAIKANTRSTQANSSHTTSEKAIKTTKVSKASTVNKKTNTQSDTSSRSLSPKVNIKKPTKSVTKTVSTKSEQKPLKRESPILDSTAKKRDRKKPEQMKLDL